jgi:hypothetical protein
MDAERRARHREQPPRGEGASTAAANTPAARPARPGARPHLLIDGVQGSPRYGTATQGRRDRIAGSGRHRWAQPVQPPARISAELCAVAISGSTTLCDQSHLLIRVHASVRDGVARG